MHRQGHLAVFLLHNSSIQRIHASPMRSGTEGCLCCYSSKPDLPPVAGYHIESTALLSDLIRRAVVQSMSMEKQGPDFAPVCVLQILRRKVLTWEDRILPYQQLQGSDSLDPFQLFLSFYLPRNLPVPSLFFRQPPSLLRVAGSQ